MASEPDKHEVVKVKNGKLIANLIFARLHTVIHVAWTTLNDVRVLERT